MYEYLLLRYALGGITERELRYNVPKWLTRQQAEEIIALASPPGAAPQAKPGK